jgi:hypothetical protein
MTEIPAANGSQSTKAGGEVISSDLSKLIVEFADPLLQHCTTFAAREKAVSLAVLAWNLSLEGPDAQAQERQNLEEMVDAGEREQIHQLFDYLIQRKRDLYAANRFYIVDYELVPRGEGMEIRMETKYIKRS